MAGRQWNPEIVPDPGLLYPPGVYEFEIEDITEGLSSTQKCMYTAKFRCAGPDMVGMPYTEYYVLGSDEDPQFTDPATVGPGASNLKWLLKKAGAELTYDLDDDISRAIGQHILAEMLQRPEPPTRPDGTQNPYAGRVNSRISRVYQLGERELGVAAGQAATAPAPAPTRTLGARPAAPAPAAPRGRGRPPGPAAPAPRSMAPAPAPAPAPQPISRAPKEQMLVCSICRAQVTRREFAAHVNGHENQQE